MLVIYIVITIFLLLIFEIFSSYMLNNEQNFEENINDKKAIIVIPLSSLGSNSVIDEYFDDIELSPFYSNEHLNRCYYLLNKYNSCFKLKQNKIGKCKKIYMDKIEKEMCNSIKEQIFNQSLVDFGDIFQEETDDIFECNSNDYLTRKNVKINAIEKDNNDLILNNNSNKDCIEYGLSENNEDFYF